MRELDGITYGAGESWQQMLRQGEELLQQFVAEGRVHIAQPQASLQRKLMRRLDTSNEFIGYVDAIGTTDRQPCLIDWKSSGSAYPAQPNGIVALNPQLVCYSWLTGIAGVALVLSTIQCMCIEIVT